MSTRNRALLTAAMLLASTVARSDGIFNPTANGVGQREGIINMSSGGAPPPTCNGTINLSTGCAQGMLGGL